MNPNALVIMAKEPRVGSTKTRLCPPLSQEEAAAISEALLQDTIRIILDIDGLDLAIAITPPESEAYFKGIALEDTVLIPVEGVDIGECQLLSLDRLLKMGYQKVFALNGDSPSLPVEYIQQAIQGLEDHDMVLGPTEDGGYYLIGFKEAHPEIFDGVEWSTERVSTQILQIASKLNMSVEKLPPWYDVDTVSDFDKLQVELISLPSDSLPNTRKFLSQWSKQM